MHVCEEGCQVRLVCIRHPSTQPGWLLCVKIAGKHESACEQVNQELWGGRGRNHASMSCRDCFGDLELLWRRVSEALLDSWRLWSTSDMLKQAPLQKMQMGSVWLLAKCDKTCSAGFISRNTETPPSNCNPGLLSHPELEGAKWLYVLGRVRRNYVYCGNRLPQSHLCSLFTTLEIQQPFLSGYTMENHHHHIVQMQPAHTGAIFEMSCPSLGWGNCGNASPAIFNACFTLIK